jgi:hypothetical protein
MKLNTRNIGGTYYTEYTVRAGETLKQIAREQLHNENLTTGIYRLNNNVPEIKPIAITENISGWTLLLPPVPADFLSMHKNAVGVLTELKNKADKGTITAEDYYSQRKMVLAAL